MALEGHLVPASPRLRMAEPSNYLFPVSPFPLSSAEISFPFFTSNPTGKGAGILLPAHVFGVFFSCETSEKPVLTTILMQDSRDGLY